MKTIYKYPLKTDKENIKMPLFAQILCIQVQGSTPCIWALVDPDKELETRTFLTFGTGYEVTGIDNEYVGTYQLHSGQLVFHVFEVFI